jgi:hypothetical protein
MITGGSAMRIAGSPSIGKTLLTRTLHNILNERSVENFDTVAIIPFWVPFIFIPCFEF